MRWGRLGMLLGLVPIPAFAMCTCECVDGAVQALCDNALEVAPVCPARICPAVPPSLPSPSMRPPAGASAYRAVQMLNPLPERYQWRQICE